MTNLTPLVRSQHRKFRGLLVSLVSALALTVAAYAASASKKNFELPAGEATSTLKTFSEQSGEQIVYPVDLVRGLQTNAVRGELTAREALDAMLEKTGLAAVQDEKTGALAIKKIYVPEMPKDSARPKLTTAAVTNEVAPLDEPDVFVLSPFEVSSGHENGYAAATSLAGNRLSTELRDVGSAISVVTAQMLKDIGATSNETLLQYTTNTEVGNIYGNMANAGSGTLLDENSKFANPNQNTRVRGLVSADSTVNYFLTDIPWDSYNVDRVDFQRGPNAMLFGLGSPAGIINAGTKIASMKNEGQIELRYSRFGSMRGSLDVNRVLLDKQLAFRIDALDDKQKFQQTPSFQNDKRVYGALRFDPALLNKGSAHTSFKANFEQGQVRSNRPRTLTPGDGITPWFFTGTAKGYNADGSTFQYNNLNRLGFDARGLMDGNFAGQPGRGQFNKSYNGSAGPGTPPSGTLNPDWQPWLGGQFAASYFGNPLAIFGDGQASAHSFIALEPSTIRGISTTGAIDRGIGGIPFSRASSVTLYRDISKKVNLPGAKFGLTRSITLEDPSIFDFYNNLLDGPNKNEWQNFKRYNFNLAQTFFNNDVGFEAAYDKQKYDNGQITLMSARSLQVYVDVMQTLADGTTNPNFGRPFIADDGTGGSQSFANREATRLTAYARHDFDRGEHRSILTRILGKHTITGLYSDDERENSSRSFVHYVADNGYKDFVNGYGSAPSTIDSTQRKVQQIIYLGKSLKDATTAAGANIPGPTATAVVTGGSIRAFDSTWIATTVNPADVWQNPLYPVGHPFRISTQSENPANYRGWINTPITVTDSEAGHRDQNTNFSNKSKNTVTSKAFNWQGYFWDGAFVGTYGYRTDTAKAWSVTATRDLENHPILDPQLYKFPDAPIIVSDNSKSWSVVMHINELLQQRLPLNVSAFYNRSENFQPLAGRVSALGNALSAPKGKTTDYGVRLSTKDDKYALKINRYETVVKDAGTTSGFSSQFFLGQLFTEGQESRNRFVFEVSDPRRPETYHSGDSNQWIYQPGLGQTPEQALAAQKADVAGWDAMIKSLPAQFLTTWKIDTNQSQLSDLKTISYTQPSGLTVTEDNVSKGLEFELYAHPVRGLRLTLNASKSEAVRTNVGDPTWNTLVNQINTALNTTGAGSLRANSNASSATSLERWNANFWASWLSVKGQENSAVTELRAWRVNTIMNYDFSDGMLKGINVGAGIRWQDKVIIGYTPRYFLGNTETDPFKATTVKYDLEKPYYGPAETNIDLWIGYTHKLTKKINYRVQVNVRNVGKGNSLIPITVQPDGTVAAWRIAPTQVWSLTNTLEF